MFAVVRASAIFIAVSLFSACAIMPDLPPDWALPQQKILLHVACELRAALRGLDGRTNPKQFDARGWQIKVTLNPKIDADIQPGAGETRKSSGLKRFMSWVVGSGNGITAETRGDRSGSVDFSFDSAELIDSQRLPCEMESPSYHALTRTIGIKDWLYRAADAMNLTGSSIDKPSFTSEVFIKFNGSGS
jgi:hypothetical protein